MAHSSSHRTHKTQSTRRNSQDSTPPVELGSPTSGTTSGITSGITIGSQDTPPHKRDPKVEKGDVEELTPASKHTSKDFKERSSAE